jgi:hypothetical protein
MVPRHLALLVLLLVAPLRVAAQASTEERSAAAYYPDATWQHKTPSEMGINPQSLTEAIDFAVANETRAPRDLVMGHYETFGREPFGEAIGPIKDRGDPTGSSFATVTSWPNGVIRSAWTWPTV